MTKDTMKQQVDAGVKLSLRLDATKSERGIVVRPARVRIPSGTWPGRSRYDAETGGDESQ